MATFLVCDRCHGQLPMESPDRAEWTAVALAKQSQPSIPFQKADLCEDCTAGLRRYLQMTVEPV